MNLTVPAAVAALETAFLDMLREGPAASAGSSRARGRLRLPAARSAPPHLSERAAGPHAIAAPPALRRGAASARSPGTRGTFADARGMTAFRALGGVE